MPRERPATAPTLPVSREPHPTKPTHRETEFSAPTGHVGFEFVCDRDPRIAENSHSESAEAEDADDAEAGGLARFRRALSGLFS
jgi:hypothetical protein